MVVNRTIGDGLVYRALPACRLQPKQGAEQVN